MSYMTRRQKRWLWFWLAVLAAVTALILTAPRPDAQFDEYGPATPYQEAER